MGEVIALALKDIRLLIRDRAGLVVTFIFPLVYAIFFGVIFSNRASTNASIKIAVVDEDNTPVSQALVVLLDKAAEFETARCDRVTAVDDVRHGRVTGYVAIPAGFGSNFDPPFSTAGATLELGIDPSRQPAVGMIQGLLVKYGMALADRSLADPRKLGERIRSTLANSKHDGNAGGARARRARLLEAWAQLVETDPNDTRLPGLLLPPDIRVNDVTRQLPGGGNAYAVAFPQGIMWGVLGCTAAFGISFVTERTRGTLVRLQAAPLGRGKIMAGKAGACFLTTVTLAVALFIVAWLAFEVRPLSYLHLVMAIVSMAVAFVGIMMLLSLLGTTEQAASGITWAGLLAMAMLGGAMVPHFLMPGWLQRISDYSPVRWAILAMDAAVWRGFTLTEMLKPCAILITVGATCFGIGAFAFQRAERR